MSIVKQIKKPQMLILRQDTADKSAFRTIHALAAYWKFEYLVRYLGESDQGADVERYTHILIHYREQDLAYENWCSSIIGNQQKKKVLLIDNLPKEYGQEMQSAFGIRGIREVYGRDNRKITVENHKAQILAGLAGEMSLKCFGDEISGTIDCIIAQKLLKDQDGACCLSQMYANYCLSVPIWQWGVPSFPQYFNILRNFIFFAEGLGHFSPYPYASLRIDDFPLTSEQYLKDGGVSDEERDDEVGTLCAWSEEFSTRLEFMVNSKVMDRSGVLREIESLVPKSVATLKNYFDRGIINVNAHGRSHVDEDSFRSAGEISPFEFRGLSVAETREHLKDCIVFIERFFGKKATGFVPPSWGYREHLTKEVCADLFSFVIDSIMNYRTENDWPITGFLDKKGMVHLVETWHTGSRHFDHTDAGLWQTFMACGIPVHMMAHGLYLSDPVLSGGGSRLVVLALYAAIFPFMALWKPVEVLRLFSGLTSSRKWNRLGLLRKVLVKLPGFRKASVRNLLKVGQMRGVHWIFTEELAEHLREYASLELKGSRKDGSLYQIEFEMGMDAKGPFLFHLPQPVISAALDGAPLLGSSHHNTLELVDLQGGPHTLTIRME